MAFNGKARRVVVTGMGAVTPIGLTVKDFWKNALAGVGNPLFISGKKLAEELSKSSAVAASKPFSS